MSDRGMKKWAPYKSLPEHDPKIIEMRKERNKIERPVISNEVAEEINEVLTNYHGQVLTVKYFKSGYIKFVDSKIIKIDIYNRVLVLEENLKINFIDVLYLKEKD